MESYFLIMFVVIAILFLYFTIRTQQLKQKTLFDEITSRGHWEIDTWTGRSTWIPGTWRTPFGNLPEEKCVELSNGSWLFPEEPTDEDEPKVVVTSQGQTIVTGNLIKHDNDNQNRN